MPDQDLSGPPLRLERADGIAIITINRPRVKNAFTVEMWRTLHGFADQLGSDPAVRVLILQGAGGEVFTSGSDIREFAAMGLAHVDANFQLMEEAITAVERLPLPTIACLNGLALGGGLELALACDLRVAAERAALGMPIARLGIKVSPRFAKRIADLAGPSRAKDLLYTGRFVGAGEALAMGMVNYVVAAEELDGVTRELAQRIAGQSAAAVRAAKEAVARSLPLSEATGSKEAYAIDPQDFPEGVAAFLEKRTPNFRR